MFRAVLFLGLSIIATSANAADLKIVSYAGTSGTVYAEVKGGMATPGMPAPVTYTTVDLTPRFYLMVMPGMGVFPMYMGHQGSVSSATLQGKGYVPGSMVNVNGYYLQGVTVGPDGTIEGPGFITVPCSYSWE